MPAESATIEPGPVRGASGKGKLAKYGLRGIALGYLFALLLIPVILIAIGIVSRRSLRHAA